MKVRGGERRGGRREVSQHRQEKEQRGEHPI
jgi:hypothetical protein